MQKWDYCVIRGIHNASNEWRVIYPRLYVFTERGAELVTDFQKREITVSEHGAVAQAIARLGEDGWEMVGSANDGTGSAHSLYFRRPRE
jgi:hypothetical protein